MKGERLLTFSLNRHLSLRAYSNLLHGVPIMKRGLLNVEQSKLHVSFFGWDYKPDTSSDKLQRCARCTVCGTKGATLQQPGWMGEQIGFAPFPVPKVADEAAR
jgi:hypothetical protein